MEQPMRRLPTMIAVAVLVSAMTVIAHAQRGGVASSTAPNQRLWWVAKERPGQYGQNKPHIKLADLKARHQGEANWTEVVVDDENFHVEYSQGAPGAAIGTRMRPDTREFF